MKPELQVGDVVRRVAFYNVHGELVPEVTDMTVTKVYQDEVNHWRLTAERATFPTYADGPALIFGPMTPAPRFQAGDRVDLVATRSAKGEPVPPVPGLTVWFIHWVANHWRVQAGPRPGERWTHEASEALFMPTAEGGTATEF